MNNMKKEVQQTYEKFAKKLIKECKNMTQEEHKWIDKHKYELKDKFKK